MKKIQNRYKIELIILAALIIIEVVVIACTYKEALMASSADCYMTAILTIFINIDILYGIIILILNSNSQSK